MGGRKALRSIVVAVQQVRVACKVACGSRILHGLQAVARAVSYALQCAAMRVMRLDTSSTLRAALTYSVHNFILPCILTYQ